MGENDHTTSEDGRSSWPRGPNQKGSHVTAEARGAASACPNGWTSAWLRRRKGKKVRHSAGICARVD
jgi:hypothetical protein